jgi:hypothetical protein
MVKKNQVKKLSNCKWSNFRFISMMVKKNQVKKLSNCKWRLFRFISIMVKKNPFNFNWQSYMLKICQAKNSILKTMTSHISTPLKRTLDFLKTHLVAFKNQQLLMDKFFHQFTCVDNFFKNIQMGIFKMCLLCTFNFRLCHWMQMLITL